MNPPGGNEDASKAARSDDARFAADLSSIAHSRRTRERVYGWRGVFVSVGLFLATGIAAAVPLLLHDRGVIDGETADWLMPVAILTIYFGGFFGGFRWLYRRGPAHVLPASYKPPEPYVPPAPSGPPLDARQLRLARHAEPRLELERALGRSALASLDVIIGGSLLAPLGVGLSIFTFQAANGTLNPAEAEPHGLSVGWLVFVLGVSLLSFLRIRRKRRRAARRNGLAPLAATLNQGKLHETHGPWLRWLNEHWAAPSRSDDLFFGSLQSSVTGSVAGYPVLVDVELDGYSDDESTHEPRTLVYVAAHVPPDFNGRPQAVAASARLATLDARLEVHPDAGLLARTTLQRTQAFKGAPSELAELRRVIDCLVDAARTGGAPPAAPDPAARTRLEAVIR